MLSPLANAIALADYREPSTASDKVHIDFRANANSGGQDQTSYNAFLDGLYNKRASSDQRVFGYRLDANVNALQGPNDEDDTVSDYGFSVRANIDQYFDGSNDKLFYFGEVSFAYQYSDIDDSFGLTVGLGMVGSEM